MSLPPLFLYSIYYWLKNSLLVESKMIKSVFISSHWFLKTAWSTWFVYLHHLLLLIYLKERTYVMRFRQKQTMVTRSSTEILFLEICFNQHWWWWSLIEERKRNCSALHQLLFLMNTLQLFLKIFYNFKMVFFLKSIYFLSSSLS